MKELQLTPEQKNKYDVLMEEIRKELEALPPTDGIYFSCAKANKPYHEIGKKYQKKILEIIKEVVE